MIEQCRLSQGGEETLLAGRQTSQEIVWMSWSFLFPVSMSALCLKPSELDKKEII